MTTLKNYYITVIAHEIHEYSYCINAKDADEARRIYLHREDNGCPIADEFIQTTSETITSIEEE